MGAVITYIGTSLVIGHHVATAIGSIALVCAVVQLKLDSFSAQWTSIRENVVWRILSGTACSTGTCARHLGDTLVKLDGFLVAIDQVGFLDFDGTSLGIRLSKRFCCSIALGI